MTFKVKAIALCFAVALLATFTIIGVAFPQTEHTEHTSSPPTVDTSKVEDVETEISLPPLDPTIYLSSGAYMLESSTVPLTFAYRTIIQGNGTTDTAPRIIVMDGVMDMTATREGDKLIQHKIPYTATLEAVTGRGERAFEEFFQRAFDVSLENVTCVYSPRNGTLTFSTETDTIVFAMQNDIAAYQSRLEQMTVDGVCTISPDVNDTNQ